MGVMKDFFTTVRNGGEEAVAAVQRMGDDWRAMLDQAASELEAMRLTDAEREAVEAAARIIDAYEEEMDGFPSGAAATLRGLLERMK